MENENQSRELYKRYLAELSAIDGVKCVVKHIDQHEEARFTSTAPNSLPVQLEYVDGESPLRNTVFLLIERADCAYWHTIEYEDLDDYIPLAKAALAGDVAYNKSPIMGFREVCFKVDNTWHCTRMGLGTDMTFHYTTERKKLRRQFTMSSWKSQ